LGGVLNINPRFYSFATINWKQKYLFPLQLLLYYLETYRWHSLQ